MTRNELEWFEMKRNNLKRNEIISEKKRIYMNVVRENSLEVWKLWEQWVPNFKNWSFYMGAGRGGVREGEIGGSIYVQINVKGKKSMGSIVNFTPGRASSGHLWCKTFKKIRQGIRKGGRGEEKRIFRVKSMFFFFTPTSFPIVVFRSIRWI